MTRTAVVITLLVCFAMVGIAGQTQAIRAELEICKVASNGDWALDVYVTNTTTQDIACMSLSPVGNVGAKLIFASLTNSATNYVVIGGLSRDWDQWYLLRSGKTAIAPERIVFPRGKRLHILHGSLLQLLLRQRKTCSDWVREAEKTKDERMAAEFREGLDETDRLLQGGTFNLSVVAYTQSNVVRIDMPNYLSRHEEQKKGLK